MGRKEKGRRKGMGKSEKGRVRRKREKRRKKDPLGVIVRLFLGSIVKPNGRINREKSFVIENLDARTLLALYVNHHCVWNIERS